MAGLLKTLPVKGGTIKRVASSGRFVEVNSSKGTSRSSGKTVSVVKQASAKRSSALQRLADR